MVNKNVFSVVSEISDMSFFLGNSKSSPKLFSNRVFPLKRKTKSLSLIVARG
jgi:hypothetical protein